MSMNKRLRSLGVALAASLLLTGLAACGSGSNSSSDGSSGSDNKQVAEAIALVAKYSATPSNVGVTEPIKGNIPTGKTVDFMMCGAPACQSFVDPMKKAAETLGWKLVVVTAGPTPDKVTEGWNLAVENKPDAVISTGYPEAAWAVQLKKLNDMRIPVVECCTTDPVGQGVIFVDTSASTGAYAGAMQADWVIADTKGKSNTVYLNVPAYPILAEQLKGFTTEYQRLCAGCKLDTLDLNVGDLGTPAMTATIVGYLQSHPDVNYMAAGSDDAYLGLPAAVTGAGLKGKVRGIGLSPSTANLNYIKSGQLEVATISFPQPEISWKLIDVLARNFAGSSLDAAAPMVPRIILTKANIANPDVLAPAGADYEAQFKALWHKS